MNPTWTYDEFRHIGVDFDDPKQVETYDKRQGSRVEDERSLVTRLGIGSESTVLEYGIGTGAFAIAAGETGARVIGLDISTSMLEFAEKKARDGSLDSLEFHRSSFLTHDQAETSVDFVVTKFALHHLPDFWKVAALRKMWQSLRPGGILYLQDVVFSFQPDEQESVIEEWIDGATRSGSFSREEFEMHVREEYSTYGPLMEAMLRMAGFRIKTSSYYSKVQAEYVCERG